MAPRIGALFASSRGMVRHVMPLLAIVAQEQLVRDLQNFLARTVRALVRLGSGHETLIVVILILLLIIYLYLQKA